MSPDDVRTERVGRVGHLVLNRAEAINALTRRMILRVRGALSAWGDDPGVEAIVIRGNGDRGFCAGGDVRVVYRSALGDGSHARALWRDEYRMDAEIARYTKPIVSVMHGLVLGGGIGIAAHASYRMVTDSARLGMPEVTIGLAPDVGGTWLLARSPGEVGTHLALTGTTVGYADALYCGLADVYVDESIVAEVSSASDWTLLADLIERCRASAPGSGTDVGERNSLRSERTWIDECYAGDSVREIVRRLNASSSERARSAAETIAAKSPVALEVTLQALRRARTAGSLEEVLEQDYRVSSRCLERADLVEGIRAQLIDKDRSPRWLPANLNAVDPQEVASHFLARAGDEFVLDRRTVQ